MENNCFGCEHCFNIPSYLQKHYAEIGMNFPVGTTLCGLIRNILPSNNTCNEFEEREWEDDKS